MKQPANISSHESVIPPRWLLTLGGVTLGLWLLFALKEIVFLLVVGYCIAYIIDPLLGYLERKKISRSLGVGIIFGSALILLLLLSLTAYPTLEREYEKLSTNLPAYIDEAKSKAGPLFEKLRTALPKNPLTKGEPIPSLPTVSGEAIKGVIGTVFTALLSGYNIVLIIFNTALLPFIVYYLAIDLPRLHRLAIMVFPARRRRKVLTLASEIDRSVSAFVRGQLLVGAILSILYMLGLSFIGVELSVLLALISGFGNLIPYFGFLSGIILSSVLALVTFGDLSHLIQVFVLYGLVQALEGTFITPKIVGEKVGLSPLMIILAIFIGGKLFGLLGIFLAIPGVAIVRVLLRELHQWLITRAELNYD